MLFKFASYLLGTNNDSTNEQQYKDYETNQSNNNSENTQLESNGSTSISNNELNKADENLMYNECYVRSSDETEDSIEKRLEDELYDEEDQWIYITPIRKEQSTNDDKIDEQASNLNVPKNDNQPRAEFNFYDYFQGSSTDDVDEKEMEDEKQGTTCNYLPSKIEDSWIIHPPACFQLDNTFSIEEHPLENLYIENPQLSVISSQYRGMNKENNLTEKKHNKNTPEKSSKNCNKNANKGQNMHRHRTNECARRKLSEKRMENEQNNSQKQQVLRQKQEKQLLAHYLTMDPTKLNTEVVPETTSNGSLTKKTDATRHNSRSKKNNKGLQRINSAHLPFTLHRKLC